jgi:hypothetical protein
MRAKQFILESPLADLENNIPNHLKHGHRALDVLMSKIAHRHHITSDALHDLFKRKHKKSPHDLLKDRLEEEGSTDETQTFIQWAIKTLNIHDPAPEITLSTDSEAAQKGHHTGLNLPQQNKIWIYIGNRNLIDQMRTIFHELVHAKQYQLGRIGPNDSYPGSKIEMVADAMAGIAIKIYAKAHPEIIQ